MILHEIRNELRSLHEENARIMAAIDDLNTALTTIDTAVTKLQGDVQTLITDLQTAQGAGNVDLTAAIAHAQAIAASLGTIDSAVDTATGAAPTANVK